MRTKTKVKIKAPKTHVDKDVDGEQVVVESGISNEIIDDDTGRSNDVDREGFSMVDAEKTTMIVEGVERKVITSEDLLKIENLHLSFLLNDSVSRESALMAEKIELEASKKIHSLRAKIATLSEERNELIDRKRRTLNALSEKYGVNFNSDSVVYDDVTGIITVVDEPWKRGQDEKKDTVKNGNK